MSTYYTIRTAWKQKPSLAYIPFFSVIHGYFVFCSIIFKNNLGLARL